MALASSQPTAPNFWNTRKWGALNNEMDYYARCFLRTDPAVWSHLVAYTRQMLAVAQSRDQRLRSERSQLTPVAQGKLQPLKPERIGIKCCVERMRYEIFINRGPYNAKFKFPNEYTSYFARLLAVEIDDLASRIGQKQVKQDPTWQAELVAKTLHMP